MASKGYSMRLRQNLMPLLLELISLLIWTSCVLQIRNSSHLHRQWRLDLTMAACAPCDLLILKLCFSEHLSASASTVK